MPKPGPRCQQTQSVYKNPKMIIVLNKGTRSLNGKSWFAGACKSVPATFQSNFIRFCEEQVVQLYNKGMSDKWLFSSVYAFALEKVKLITLPTQPSLVIRKEFKKKKKNKTSETCWVRGGTLEKGMSSAFNPDKYFRNCIRAETREFGRDEKQVCKHWDVWRQEFKAAHSAERWDPATPRDSVQKQAHPRFFWGIVISEQMNPGSRIDSPLLSSPRSTCAV